MYIQPLQAVESPGCYQVGGDVTIHPSATIAPGVLIRADANCTVNIGSSACVGMGVVIHACEGSIEIESGVSLGAAVLIVGHAAIGANASIGSSTTIRNCTIDSGAIIPAASLLGELGDSRNGASKQPLANVAEPNNGSGLLGDIHSSPECSNGVTSYPVSLDSDDSDPAEVVTATNSGSTPKTQSPSALDDGPHAPANGHVRDSVSGQFNGPTSGDSTIGTDESLSDNNPTVHTSLPTPANSRPLVSGPPVNGNISSADDIGAGEEVTDGTHQDSLDRAMQNGAGADGANNGHPRSDLVTTQQSLLAPQPVTPQPSPAFGKSQVNRLMRSLFPHSKTYADNSSPSDDAIEGVTSEPRL